MKKLFYLFILISLSAVVHAQSGRSVLDFDQNWTFNLGDVPNGQNVDFNDASWRKLNLPHDWSIEGEFKKENLATVEGGALPGGIGWYRKTFTSPQTDKGKLIYIAFDGVYQKSDVWINGHHLGYRPNGYISFRYELTPYLNYGGKKNVIAVKADNSVQPNSRWYSGSGIYRNVWLISTNKIAVNHWGTFVTTPNVSASHADVNLSVSIKNAAGNTKLATIVSSIYANGKVVASKTLTGVSLKDMVTTVSQNFGVNNPVLWSVNKPFLYKVQTKILVNNVVVDHYETPLGIRYFNFDENKGFSLNGVSMKINGVCEHHDLGALGTAFNVHALERQFKILKEMGVNAIRTSHNPPAPEFLELADRMGFIIMDEAFDVWQVGKRPKFDYHIFFYEWHKRDLVDQILRDRNHPSVIIWSIGNEIPEQKDTSAARIARELTGIIHELDTTRPITTANSEPGPGNKIVESGAVDLVGYNYHNEQLATFQKDYPGKKFIGTETASALESRGVYNTSPDTIQRWPGSTVVNGKRVRRPMNADNTVNAYDNISAPWGFTHEETWKIYKKHAFLSGQFIWTGFDYIGEPWPYQWPSRSSYFGIVDLAGFPKDVYYMYQGEWTNKTVLHLLPHWNWEPGKVVDVWAYYSNADEVELFLNGKSLGTKSKQGDDLHIAWKVNYEPGTLKAVSRKNGKVVLTTEVKTAGAPARIELSADRSSIGSNDHDLSFITVKIVDKNGIMVPNADNDVKFKLSGADSFLAGVDNGSQTSHESFKADHRKAFNGLALAIIGTKNKPGTVTITATADGLPPASLPITIK
jgi:beta-galactosidase